MSLINDLLWQFMTNTKRRLLGLTFYRGITISIAPHPHGNPVRRHPIPAVLRWMWSHYRSLLQYSRRPHYRANLYSRGVIVYLARIISKLQPHLICHQYFTAYTQQVDTIGISSRFTVQGNQENGGTARWWRLLIYLPVMKVQEFDM